MDDKYLYENLILFAKFDKPYQAEVVKAFLESEGVKTVVTDDKANIYSQSISMIIGTKLYIRKHDLTYAIELLPKLFMQHGKENFSGVIFEKDVEPKTTPFAKPIFIPNSEIHNIEASKANDPALNRSMYEFLQDKTKQGAIEIIGKNDRDFDEPYLPAHEKKKGVNEIYLPYYKRIISVDDKNKLEKDLGIHLEITKQEWLKKHSKLLKIIKLHPTFLLILMIGFFFE